MGSFWESVLIVSVLVLTCIFVSIIHFVRFTSSYSPYLFNAIIVCYLIMCWQFFYMTWILIFKSRLRIVVSTFYHSGSFTGRIFHFLLVFIYCAKSLCVYFNIKFSIIICVLIFIINVVHPHYRVLIYNNGDKMKNTIHYLSTIIM